MKDIPQLAGIGGLPQLAETWEDLPQLAGTGLAEIEDLPQLAENEDIPQLAGTWEDIPLVWLLPQPGSGPVRKPESSFRRARARQTSATAAHQHHLGYLCPP